MYTKEKKHTLKIIIMYFIPDTNVTAVAHVSGYLSCPYKQEGKCTHERAPHYPTQLYSCMLIPGWNTPTLCVFDNQ